MSGNILVTAGRRDGLSSGHLLAITRKSEFIAIVAVTRIHSKESEAVVWRNLSIGRIRPGDQARTVENLRSYMSGISRPAKLDLGSKLNLERIRSLMRTVK